MRTVLRYAGALMVVLATTAGFKVLKTGPANDGECMGCHRCTEISGNWIVPAISTAPDKWWDITSFYCSMEPFGGHCWELGACIPPLLDEAEKAIAARDMGQLRKLLRKDSKHMIFVPERNAVQLLDCAGNDVRAQLAIPDEWRAALAAFD